MYDFKEREATGSFLETFTGTIIVESNVFKYLSNQNENLKLSTTFRNNCRISSRIG